MLSIIGRMVGAAAPAARSALGSIGSGAASLARGVARAVGGGLSAVGGYLFRGASNNRTPNQNNGPNDANAFVDSSINESRGSQLASYGSQPSPVGGLGNEQPRNGDGFASSAILALLRSIDTGIKSLREEMHANTVAESNSGRRKEKGPPRNYSGSGSMLSFGLGMLGSIANSIFGNNENTEEENNQNPPQQTQTPQQTQPQVTPQPKVNPDIAGPANQNTEQLEQGLGMAPTPNPYSLQQTPTVENRQPFRNDLSQLNNLLEETRERQREYAARNRNPQRNSLSARMIASAENSLNALRQQYESGNTDQEQIGALRDEFMRNISAARNSIGITVTPEIQTPEIPQDATPSTPDATPGPQSSVEDGLVNVVANRDIDLYSSDTISDPTKNSYVNYMMAAMANTNKISIASENGSLTLKDIISGNEDNVSRKLNAIQVANPVGGQGSVVPIVINNGGNDARPAVIPVPSQQNTPAPSPGTGAIIIGYKSHPMLVNESRSPAFFSHP